MLVGAEFCWMLSLAQVHLFTSGFGIQRAGSRLSSRSQQPQGWGSRKARGPFITFRNLQKLSPGQPSVVSSSYFRVERAQMLFQGGWVC